MKSKKKLIITLCVSVSVLLIVVISLVAIFAAANQNITSNVNVSYRPSEQVKGRVCATYTFGNDTHSMTTDGEILTSKNEYVSFEYKEQSKVKTLQMQKSDLKNGALELFSNNYSIIFAFTFVNQGISDFDAILDTSEIKTRNNVSLTYSLDNKNWTIQSPNVNVPAPPGGNGGHSVVCYIKVEVDNKAHDANFEGSFIWDLVTDDAI